MWLNLCRLRVKKYLYPVKVILQILLILSVLFVFDNSVHASRVSKAFEALDLKDYFKAKKLFTKGLKYSPEVSAYGLSIIYSRNDNPFYSKDSAYRYIIIADTSWARLKEKKKIKWSEYGFSRSAIDSMKQVVSNQFFREARSIHTVEAYSNFLETNPWSNKYDNALISRDSLAFFQAVEGNTAKAYKEFLNTYPHSAYAEMAQDNFFNAEFYEKTNDGSVDSYLKFIHDHPESPLRPDAENEVYKLVTQPNTLQAYELFVLGYEDNRNSERAWKEYYQLYIYDYSKERIQSYLDKYPQATNREEVEKDLIWFDYILLQNSVENNLGDWQYGYMDGNGKQIIPPVYDFAGTFKEGLAAVVMDGKYGFINKLGKLIIPCVYDGVGEFNEGRCIVERDEKWGMIDRNNKLLLGFLYEDLGDVSDGLIYLSKGEMYGYANMNGVLVIPEKFEEAYDFYKKQAKVEEDGKYGMINSSGEYLIQPEYEELTPLTDSLLLCTLNGRKGLITRNGTTVIPPKYDQIGAFKDGLALVSHSDTVEYIDISGNVVISKGYRTFPNFLSKGEFNQGTAIVYNKKGKYGKINTYGNSVTDIEYDNLGRGSKYVPFEKKGVWGLLSSSNKVLIPAKYESIDVVDEKYIVARMMDSIGVMDFVGNLLIPFEFSEVEYLKDGVFVVRKDQFYGMYVANQLIAPLEYTGISLFNDDFVHLIKDNAYSYYDLKRAAMVETKEDGE